MATVAVDSKTALLGELVTRVMVSAIDLAVRSTDGTELTVSQFRALAFVANHEPTRLTELAGALRVAPSSATETCDRLVQAGMLERRRDADDLRVVRLALTSRGRHELERVRARRIEQMHNVLSQIPQSQHDEVLAALELVADALGAPSDDWAIFGWR
jgi:DNA-binding MarR family transcriptional regulator